MAENLKRQKNGNIITCGIILVDNNGSILAGHPTGRGYDKECYDLLKGCSDVGENDLDTAIRELREESGLDVSEARNEIIDLGIHEYIRGKDIHLFKLQANLNIDLSKLWCTTYFTGKHGITKPEINGYKIIKKNERFYFTHALEKLIDKLI